MHSLCEENFAARIYSVPYMPFPFGLKVREHVKVVLFTAWFKLQVIILHLLLPLF